MPSNCGTLIHLVSDQTMQNILPILALKPRKVVQVVSDVSNIRFTAPADRIREAVGLAGQKGADFRFDVEWLPLLDLRSPAPSISDTENAVAALFKEHSSAIVNYTGGTKNMSIGAWLAAKKAGVPTMYCDTPREFVAGGTGAIAPSFTLREVAGKLTVPLILASQGLKEGIQNQWTYGDIPPEMQALGVASSELIRNHGEQFRGYRLELLHHGIINGDKPKPADVARVREHPIPLPAHQDFDAFFAQAITARLLCSYKSKLYYNIDVNGSNARVAKQIEHIAKGLTGTAYEAYVSTLLQSSKIFSSFLSNVYPAGTHPEEQGFGESDFLAYAPASLSLTLISCKSSPPKLEHLESLLARKAKFGGLFAGTQLCVESGGKTARENLLRSHCKSLGIACAIGDEVAAALGAV